MISRSQYSVALCRSTTRIYLICCMIQSRRILSKSVKTNIRAYLLKGWVNILCKMSTIALLCLKKEKEIGLLDLPRWTHRAQDRTLSFNFSLRAKKLTKREWSRDRSWIWVTLQVQKRLIRMRMRSLTIYLN
jgi:hypothetical protein